MALLFPLETPPPALTQCIQHTQSLDRLCVCVCVCISSFFSHKLQRVEKPGKINEGANKEMADSTVCVFVPHMHLLSIINVDKEQKGPRQDPRGLQYNQPTNQPTLLALHNCSRVYLKKISTMPEMK